MLSRFILISSLTTLVVGVSFAKEPKNLFICKSAVIHYQESGAYLKDQAAVANEAMVYLKNRLAQHKKGDAGKKFAMVLDIDETSLSNYSNMQHMNFGGTLEQINETMCNDANPAIQPTLALYRYAKANHIAVFFITGRTESCRSNTIRNLEKTGFTHWEGLTFKPDNYHEKTIVPYKSNARADIEKQGYEIILNIGDQKSDLAGGHAEKTFKLPNPYYFLP